MFKPTKTRSQYFFFFFFFSKHHENVRFRTVSSVAEAITQRETPRYASETSYSHPNFSHSSDPKRYLALLANCRNLFQVRQVHARLAVTKMLPNHTISNKLLNVYCQHKALLDARHLFDGMPHRDAVSWSVMAGGFYKTGDYTSCFGVFRESVRSGEPPNNYILPFVIRACKDTADLRMGKMIHVLVNKHGINLDHAISAALVDMYSKFRVIEDARHLFDKMLRKGHVTWTVMIGGYAECENATESLVLFDRMVEEGVVVDKVAMVTVAFACAKLGAMHKARTVHDYVLKNKFSLDVILGTAMIDMYAKCGSVESAKEIFVSMRERNVISWSAMIAAYGDHGRGKEALDLFSRMLSSGISPNRITFISLLYACSHSGLVAEGLRFFSSMWQIYGIRPDVKHYTCMVDLLGRAGKLDEALKLIENMSVAKDEGLWSAFLGACRVHKRMDFAMRAGRSLLEMQSRNPGHYVLISNIYANVGRWEEVAQIRQQMVQRRLKKVTGRTWLEVDHKIHRFCVADMIHPQLKEIHTVLKWLKRELDLAGYVPDKSFMGCDVDDEL